MAAPSQPAGAVGEDAVQLIEAEEDLGDVARHRHEVGVDRGDVGRGARPEVD
ncbi:Uncharacterised protein [Mycobacteroides abscessus subsp. abscessus]|nr:Uncharacterised protein [Mycobacteroides abscessus subsp. abscessus]